MLELLEKIDLPEGKEVSVTILETSTARGRDSLPSLFCRLEKGTLWMQSSSSSISMVYRPADLLSSAVPRL